MAWRGRTVYTRTLSGAPLIDSEIKLLVLVIVTRPPRVRLVIGWYAWIYRWLLSQRNDTFRRGLVVALGVSEPRATRLAFCYKTGFLTIHIL